MIPEVDFSFSPGSCPTDTSEMAHVIPVSSGGAIWACLCETDTRVAEVYVAVKTNEEAPCARYRKFSKMH